MNARVAAVRAADELSRAGVPDAAFEGELLTRKAGALSRAAYFMGPALTERETARLAALVERRRHREPFAYISGDREFYGLSFDVGPDVLIPRPETELLVDIVLREASAPGRARIVDVGTGSGCIAISVRTHCPSGDVVGVDVSAGALRVAAANAARLAPGVRFVQGDLVTAIARVDIVAANLPYIPTSDIESLEPEVRDWEPRLALDGGGDGLTLIRRLVFDCATRLRPRLLAMEVGAGQAPAVASLGEAVGAAVETHRDLGGIERVVCLRWA